MTEDEHERDSNESSDLPTIIVPIVNNAGSTMDGPDTPPMTTTTPLWQATDGPETQPITTTNVLTRPVPGATRQRTHLNYSVPPAKRTVLENKRRVPFFNRRFYRRRRFGIRNGAVLLLIIFVALLITLIALYVQPAWFTGLRNGSNPSSHPQQRRSTKLSLPARSSNAAPLISAIQPSVGVAGQTVTILGTHMVSGNGSIVALFGSTVAPTRCPNENRCLVVVPARSGGSMSIRVRLRTQAGLSNALSFNYR